MPAIVDDPAVQQAVESARTEFLSGQDFDRLAGDVLVEDETGRWQRGSVDGDVLDYPASCVKLGYPGGRRALVRGAGQDPDCLDESVRPMIVDSDNVATGVVVDAITGAPNGPVEGADVIAWLTKRRYTERVLAAAGLLGNQRLLNKTYPTNSGEEPTGLEALARQQLGRNAMSTEPRGAADACDPQRRDRAAGDALHARAAATPDIFGGEQPRWRPAAGLDHREQGRLGLRHAGGRPVCGTAERPTHDRRGALERARRRTSPSPGNLLRLNHLTELLVAKLDLARGLPVARVLLPAADRGRRVRVRTRCARRRALRGGGVVRNRRQTRAVRRPT